MPSVQAWKRLKTGAFSSSARVASFLTGLSTLRVELVHNPGRNNMVSDYNSRNPFTCSESRCQICHFASKLELEGDNINPTVKSVRVEEILNGTIKMPFNQKSAWLKVQSGDRVHRMLLNLIKTSQVPEPKKTKGVYTTLKRLHNLFKSGNLKISRDGLVTITTSDVQGNNHDAISVPTRFFPGLVHALHLKLNHPSKSQLAKLVARHFYSPGQVRIIDEVTESCVTCLSLKQMPKEVFEESTKQNDIFGAAFSADVIKKDCQLILICREKLSQFSISQIIPDESADSLRNSLISSVLEFLPEFGTTIQVDCSTGFQKLASECLEDGSILKKLGITIDLGRSHNINKNPVAENCVKEFLKERLRLSAHGGPVTEVERAQITKNMNSRIRERGYTAKEMAWNRDQITNKYKPISDPKISKHQVELRKARHPQVPQLEYNFKVGDNVFLKKDLSKLRGREMYKIVSFFQRQSDGGKMAIIRKCENKFMSKDYEVTLAELKLAIPNMVPVFDNDEDNEDISQEKLKMTDKEMGEDSMRPLEVFDSNKKIPQNTYEEVFDSNQEIPQNTYEEVFDSNQKIPQNTYDEDAKSYKDSATENGRTKRKSALKQRQLMGNLMESSLLKVSQNKKIPLHPFNYEDWVKLLDDDIIEIKKPKVNTKKIKQELIEIDDHNDDDLIWDHSPQNVNSEANYIWSEALTPRNPEDFVRLFTDEMIEEAIDNSNDTIVTDCETDDDVFPPCKNALPTTRRLLSSTSAHFLDPEFPVITPVLPETVNLERVQNLDPALALASPLLPDLVDLNQAQNLDLALAELDLEELQATPVRQDREENPPTTGQLRRSNRLKKTNSKFVGKEWENALKED